MPHSINILFFFNKIAHIAPTHKVYNNIFFCDVSKDSLYIYTVIMYETKYNVAYMLLANYC